MPTKLKEEGARVKAAVLAQWKSLVDCAAAMGESRYKLYDAVAGRPQDAEFLAKIARFCRQPVDAFDGLRRAEPSPATARRQAQMNAALALARAAKQPTEEERQRRETRRDEFARTLRRRRDQLQLSDAAVAAAVGVGAGQVEKWMAGAATPMAKRLPALARVLGLDPHTLADQLDIAPNKRPFPRPRPAGLAPTGTPLPPPAPPAAERGAVEEEEEEEEVELADPGLHGQEALRARFGRQLKGWQKDSGVSIPEIAQALGVSRNHVDKWLGGRAMPGPGRLLALARVLDVHPGNMAAAVGMTEAALVEASYRGAERGAGAPETGSGPGEAAAPAGAAVLVGSLSRSRGEPAPGSARSPRVPPEAPLSSLGLPAGILTLLGKGGVRSVGELTALTPREVAAIPYVAGSGLRKVQEMLAVYGLALAPEAPAAAVPTAAVPAAAPPEAAAPDREPEAPPMEEEQQEEEVPPPAPALAAPPDAAGPADYTASPLWKQAHQLAQLVLVGLERLQEEGPLRHALWHAIIDVPRHLALAARARQTGEMTRALHRAAECALSAEYYLRLAADMRWLPQGLGEMVLGQLAALAASIAELEPEPTP